MTETPNVKRWIVTASTEIGASMTFEVNGADLFDALDSAKQVLFDNNWQEYRYSLKIIPLKELSGSAQFYPSYWVYN